MSPRREAILSLTRRIATLDLGHPVRVGIDGATASGKSTLAKEMVREFLRELKPSTLITLDGFHNPQSIRYRRGRMSAEGYYRDAYNYSTFKKLFLDPLGVKGSCTYRSFCFDLENDCESLSDEHQASPHDIFVVDGSFSHRTELADSWDFKIYVDTPLEIAQKRAASRDAEFFGDSETAEKITETRYHGAHKIHLQESGAQEKADVVFKNADFEKPILEWRN